MGTLSRLFLYQRSSAWIYPRHRAVIRSSCYLRYTNSQSIPSSSTLIFIFYNFPQDLQEGCVVTSHTMSAE